MTTWTCRRSVICSRTYSSLGPQCRFFVALTKSNVKIDLVVCRKVHILNVFKLIYREERHKMSYFENVSQTRWGLLPNMASQLVNNDDRSRTFILIKHSESTWRSLFFNKVTKKLAYFLYLLKINALAFQRVSY